MLSFPRKIPNVVIAAKDPQYRHSRKSGNPLLLETNLDSRFRGNDDVLLARDCYREIATARLLLRDCYRERPDFLSCQLVS
jgi:hypothetical protein